MFLRLITQPIHLVIGCSLLLATTLAVPLTQAESPDRADQNDRCYEIEAWCGWVELGTHDSLTMRRQGAGAETRQSSQQEDAPDEPPVAEESLVEVEEHVAEECLVTNASPGANASPVAGGDPRDSRQADVGEPLVMDQVIVEEVTEPFALVGTYLNHSFDAVQQFQRWWQDALQLPASEKATVLDVVTFDFLRVETSMDRRLELIASQEPIDVQVLGPSVLVQELNSVLVQELNSVLVQEMNTFSSEAIEEPALAAPPRAEPGDGQAESAQHALPKRKDILVGCSPMIFTIEETYMAYDMSDRDVKLWCVFPTTTRPFCIRSRAANFDDGSMWDEFDQVVRAETAAQPEATPDAMASKFQCSAYCLLDDWVSRAEDALAAESWLRSAVTPSEIGARLAAVAVRGDRLASEAMMRLARQWPEVKPEFPPSPAGAALLARAGAAESPLASAEPEAIAADDSDHEVENAIDAATDAAAEATIAQAESTTER